MKTYKEMLVKSIINYLNFDQVSDSEFYSPFGEESKKRQELIKKDAENIAEIARKIYSGRFE
jgi:hypothetical protein